MRPSPISIIFITIFTLLSAGCAQPAAGPGAAQILAEQRMMAVKYQAIGGVTGLDPTGISAVAIAKAQKKEQEQWRKNLHKRQVASLPPEQRALMQQYLDDPTKNQDTFKAEMFRTYGLDEQGNYAGEGAERE